MAYRGQWRDGRAPSLGCSAEAGRGRAADTRQWCSRTDPWGRYVCTRGRGHTGDHVTIILITRIPRIFGRWGPNGELTDSEEAGHAS